MTVDNPEPQPRIIPRAEHPISRKDIDREALKVMYRLRDAGYTAYLVGGGVRDLYLGRVPKDFDISTDARPGELRKLFRNSRIIGKRFRLVQVFFPGGKIIEVSTFRRRGEYDTNGQDAVLASNNTFGNPAEDAFRRDLTINALCYEIENYTVIDYVGGVQDLEDRVIRLIGDPERRLTRDPVRMLRVIRHAARIDFKVEAGAWEAIRHHRDELRLCPVSRIRDELFKDLRGGASAAWLRLALDSGLFTVIFPFYQACLAAEDQSVPTGSVVQWLAAIFRVVDRLQQAGQPLPDDLLTGLLLLPWAQAERGLMAPRQKEENHQFARSLRQELDELLEQLNIKRADKESITSLLVNLPHLERYAKSSWPKWLKRKSYFKSCLHFYRIVEEAQGGEPVESVEAPLPPPPETRFKKRKSSRPRGGRAPAIVQKKGGIFGLK